MSLENSDAGFANNATDKLLGFEYQKLIALEKCLNAKANETIWIECFGDVADSNASTEIKHHHTDNNLTDCSVDFWKTLRNLVREKVLIHQFNELFLHTTSTVKENSIFANWNDSSASEKFDIINGVTATKTISEMHNEVFDCDKHDLLEILSKFKIESSQPNISEKFLELKQHAAMITIDDKYRDEVVKWLIGEITKSAIDNRCKWHLNINDFTNNFRFFANHFIKDDVQFPFVEKDEVDPSTNNAFRFAEEIKKIGYVKKIDRAITDYLRANLSRIKLLEDTPVISTELDRFDENTKDELNDKKITHASNVSSVMLGSDDACGHSRKLYDNCLNMPLQAIQGVQAIQKYYQNGRIHHTVNSEQFSWIFEEVDI